MRYWLLIVVVMVGIIVVPTSTYAAGTIGILCPYPKGQYYRPILPYFNARNHQAALVDKDSYRVVQTVADNIQSVIFLGYYSWSPSCHYFALYLNKELVIWDTVAQRLVGTLQWKILGLNFFDWDDTENYVIVNATDGQFLWKLPTNKQIELGAPYWYDLWYRWDTPRHQVFSWDGRYFVVYDLDTGKVVHKFISPFYVNATQLDLAPDGKALTIYDKYLSRWSVTWDRSTNKIIDAKAEPGRNPEEVQFSPDRRFILITDYGYGLSIYDVTVAETLFREPCWPYTFISTYTTGYSGRFIDSSTLELNSNRDGRKFLFDLNTNKFRSINWSPIYAEKRCGY
jgi:hypothetical protein